MKYKFSILNYLKEEKGSTMIVVILIFVVMSILGITLLNVAASNFKLTGKERDFQAVYYIAESGINIVVNDIGNKVNNLSEQELNHEDFFQRLDEYISDKYVDNESNPYIIDKNEKGEEIFELNFSEKPLAEIVIDIKDEIIDDVGAANSSKKIKNYTIGSKGKIGKLSRSVITSIKVSHELKLQVESGHHPAFDYVMYSGGNNTFANAGGADITGSIYASDIVKLEATNTKIKGSVISEKSVNLISAVEITGDVYAMDGEVKLSNSDIKMKGDIHSTGNVTLSHGTTVEGKIFTDKNVELKSSGVKVTDDIHAKGNITLGSTSRVKNLYSTRDIKFVSNGAIIDGDIHAAGNVGDNENGTSVTINGNVFSGKNTITRANQSYKILGDVYALERIENGVGNTISGNAISTKNVINNGIIQGVITNNANTIQIKSPSSPLSPDFSRYQDINNKVQLHNFEVGINNISNNSNSTKHDILPGIYNNLELKWNDTARFSSGNYYFNNINGNQSAIKLELDLSKGPINIYTKNDVKFGSGLEVRVSQDGVNYKTVNDILTTNPKLASDLAGKIYWESQNNFELPNDIYFMGSILANNNFTTSSNITLVGAYVVNNGKISMGYGPTIIYAPPTDSAAGSSGNDGNVGGGGDKGKNIIQQNLRVTTSTPIREK